MALGQPQLLEEVLEEVDTEHLHGQVGAGIGIIGGRHLPGTMVLEQNKLNM